MRSRTLGAKTIKKVSQLESISEKSLSEHRDSYLYNHFDFVITNLRNAFYKTISGKFIYSPNEEEKHFLSEYLNTTNYDEIDNILKKNHFFIESKKLTPKLNLIVE